MRYFALLLLLMFLSPLAMTRPANAACVTPAGSAGEIVYNATNKIFQYCDDTNWIRMNQPGTGSGGCTNPTLDEGKIVYNADARVPQGCAGATHQSFGPVGGAHKYTSINNGSVSGSSCALRPDGIAYCWGNNAYGQLGNNSTTAAVSPSPVLGGEVWKVISILNTHTCGIKSDDTLWCWGHNNNGRLGDNSTTQRLVPTAVNGGGTWKTVTVGSGHSCGIKSDDSLWCWGVNSSGQLGDNSTTQRLVPTAINGGGSWKMVKAGLSQTCAIKSDDTLWCWGENGSYQLGDNTTTDRWVPTAVSGGGTWKSVDTGWTHACGIKSDDTLWCWGPNSYGQLGDNSTTQRQVPTAVSGGGTWKDISARATYWSCGIKSDDTAWCWGINYEGQLGDGTTTQSLVPVAVTGGYLWDDIDGNCGIKVDGGLLCWGSNGGYRLGTDDYTFQAVPKRLESNLTWVSMGMNGSDYDGSTPTCAIDSSQQAWCWGPNWEGNLGDGTMVDQRYTPTLVSGGHSWLQIMSSSEHTCGIRTDNSAMCWGEATDGKLGNSQTAGDYLTPQAVSGGHSWKLLTLGNNHTCGIRTDDALYCWGANNAGQLGDNSTTPRSAPTAINGGGTWKYVSGGGTSTCGIKSDDTLWCWGSDSDGSLGNGATTGNQIIPVAIAAGTYWSSVSVGYNHACGVRTDGTGWCWGTNWSGPHGNGTYNDSDVPVQIPTPALWLDIDSGTDNTCGLDANKTLYCWGDLEVAGDGTSDAVPVAAEGGGQWKDVEVGDNQACAISMQNDIWCWYYDVTNGILGNGPQGFSSIPVAPFCTNPFKAAGALLYNDDAATLQYCDGAGWVGVKN